jgi:hypothetical protein
MRMQKVNRCRLYLPPNFDKQIDDLAPIEVCVLRAESR